MKRFALAIVVAALALLAFAVPASAATITQAPNTTGMTYTAGTPLTITWTSEGLPADALLTLNRAEPQPDGTMSAYGVAFDLPQQGSYTVDVPSEDGWYFYYLNNYQPISGGFILTQSNAYQDYDNGSGWWFRVGTLGDPTITQLPALGGQTYRQGQELAISWTAQNFHPDVRLNLVLEYREPDGSGDGWIIASDLPHAGSYTVTMPESVVTRTYSYYLCSELVDGGAAGVFSDQFNQWFDVIPPQAITISAPWVAPSTPRPKRPVSFEATVSPTAAASAAVSYTLHLSHWEATRVNGRRTTAWVAYPDVLLSRTGTVPGKISGAGSLPARGEWKMYVTSATADGFLAAQSPDAFFTAR